MKVAGSTAIVTGANRGIGAAFVHCLIEAGADRVYVGSRKIEAASGLIEAYPGKAVAVELDVTDEDGSELLRRSVHVQALCSAAGK
jgi:NAD(P)-dependent dehydrogenase (short-subunit alcohol dehydrogenase family)